MIKHGNLKQNIFAALEIIDTLKGVSVGARLLAASVLRKHESWKISWSWFANQMGVDRKTIFNWRNELEKSGVWRVENNRDGAKECTIIFLLNGENLQNGEFSQNGENLQNGEFSQNGENLQNGEFSQNGENLHTIKRDEFVNFNLQKENSLRAHDAHARGENLSDENSQNFTQMQNSTFAKNATLQSENFKADLNALNSGEIQANLSQNEQEKANLQGSQFVGEFSPNFANERSQNGVKTESVGHCENDEFLNKAQNADLVAMSENENEQKATQNAKNAGANLCESEKMDFLSADETQRQAREQRQNISVLGTQGEQSEQNTAQESDKESKLIETQSANAKYKGILEKFAGVIKGAPTPKSAKPKGTATQMSEYLKTQKRQNKAEKKQSARAMRLLEADEVFNERESEIKCFSKDDWDGWVEHKLARAGVHFTKQTWKNDIQKLIEASSGAKAMINHSIACAYQGLFAPRASGGGAWQSKPKVLLDI